MVLMSWQAHLSRCGMFGREAWLFIADERHTYCCEDPAPGDSFPHPFMGR